MRAPDFWWQEPGLASALLSPLAFIYGSIAATRMKKPGARAKVPVICVGNPTVGGAGKTPTALAIAVMLKEMGEKPFFLTRGYGGQAAGPLLVDLQKHNARETGDEPLLLARAFPTVVARDRAAGADLAASSGASVIVMDDGFQNPSLQKDLSLLVIDGTRGIGNGAVLPAGPLRAPLQEQYERAQAIVLVGGENSKRSIPTASLPIFAATLVSASSASALQGIKVLAFAGIGNPEKFFASLMESGAEISEARTFDDHHYFSEAEARDLLNTAQSRSLTLVTTEKDAARMSGDAALAMLAAAAKTLPVNLKFSDEIGLREILKRAVQAARAKITS